MKIEISLVVRVAKKPSFATSSQLQQAQMELSNQHKTCKLMLNNNTIHQKLPLILANPNLKPESSSTDESSTVWQGELFNVSLTAYNNQV